MKYGVFRCAENLLKRYPVEHRTTHAYGCTTCLCSTFGNAVDHVRKLKDEKAEVFEETLQDKGQRLTLDLADDVTVSGDAQMLKQLLVNMLTNAHQYAPENSPIGVSTRNDAGGGVLEVTDGGTGIPPEHREQVLQPFFRLDKSRSEAGNGLGLALVQAVCVRHGATISLEDNEPGLRIVIRFPPV